MAHQGKSHRWRHNWIPLTPAAALLKAKGSKTTAAKLRQRHGIKDTPTPGPRRRVAAADTDRPQVTADVVRSVKVSPADIKPGDTVVSSSNNGRGAGFAARFERAENLPDGSTRVHFTGGQTMTVQPGQKVTVERKTGDTVPVRKRTSKVDQAREQFGNGSREHLAALMAAQGRKRR